MSKKQKVAVLGANGQIGSRLVHRLSAGDFDVVAICRNAAGAVLLRKARCEVRLGSATSTDWNNQLLADCDVLINCVWPSGPAHVVERHNAALLRNIATRQRRPHVISLSSVAVYGSCINPDWGTFARPRPDTTYGLSKLRLEMQIERAWRNSGEPYHIVRLGHVYGAEQWLSRFIIEAALEDKFELPYDGLRPSNAVHVDDVAQAIGSLIHTPVPSGIYNLAGDPENSQNSWRWVFDWHTQTCDLAAVRPMEPKRAILLHESFLRESHRPPLVKGLFAFRHVSQGWSLEWLLGSPDFKNLANAALSLLPSPIERRVKAMSAKRIVRREIAQLRQSTTSSPFLFGDAMPGPYLQIPPTQDGQTIAERGSSLREFYQVAMLGMS